MSSADDPPDEPIAESIALPLDAVMRAELAAEHGMLFWLLQYDALSVTGLRLALWKIRTPRDLAEAIGALASHRDLLDDALCNALSAAHGVPASHWQQQLIVDVPADPRDLGDPA